MKKVRVAIIGVGSWGECHMQTYLDIPSVEVVAICEQDKERLRQMSQKYNIPNAYTDAAAIWDRHDIDLVSVVTYEKNHLQPVLEALRSGKHVIVEKPISTDLQEARLMMEEANKYGRLIAPGHLLRFDSRYTHIYESLQSGELGNPVSIYLKRSREKYLFQTYQRTHTVYELTIHDIDTAIWYAGGRVSKVKAYGRSVMKGRVPDVLWACLEFDNDVIAVLESNWMVPDRAGIAMADQTEVIAEKGNAHFETSHSGLHLWKDDNGRTTPDLHIHYSQAGKVYGALKNQLEYLTHCIGNGIHPDYISFADAVHGIEVAKAIEESATTGREIALN